MTARELAARLQITVNVAKFTCSRLHARGEIGVACHVQVDGSNRPVSRYALVRHDRGAVQLPSAFFAGMRV